MGGNRPQEDPTTLALTHCSPGNPLTHNSILSVATPRYKVDCSSIDTRLVLVPGPEIIIINIKVGVLIYHIHYCWNTTIIIT